MAATASREAVEKVRGVLERGVIGRAYVDSGHFLEHVDGYRQQEIGKALVELEEKTDMLELYRDPEYGSNVYRLKA